MRTAALCVGWGVRGGGLCAPPLPAMVLDVPIIRLCSTRVLLRCLTSLGAHSRGFKRGGHGHVISNLPDLRSRGVLRAFK